MVEHHTYKRIARFVNVVVTALVLALILIGICYWIYEEAAERHIYDPSLFLPSMKFTEARMILLVSYLMTILSLVIIQFCIQIAKDPHSDHIGPRRLVWSVFGGLIVLCYMAAAVLAATYKSQDLKSLPDAMMTELQENNYYNEYPTNFSHTGDMFDKIQRNHRCCGVSGFSDYQSTFPVNYSIPAPYSCCNLKADIKDKTNIEADDVADLESCTGEDGPDFKSGCEPFMSDLTGRKAHQLVVLGCVGAIGVFIAVFLRLSLGYAYQKMKKKTTSYDVNVEQDGSGKEPIPLVTRQQESEAAATPVDV